MVKRALTPGKRGHLESASASLLRKGFTRNLLSAKVLSILKRPDVRTYMGIYGLKAPQDPYAAAQFADNIVKRIEAGKKVDRILLGRKSFGKGKKSKECLAYERAVMPFVSQKFGSRYAKNKLFQKFASDMVRQMFVNKVPLENWYDPFFMEEFIGHVNAEYELITEELRPEKRLLKYSGKNVLALNDILQEARQKDPKDARYIATAVWKDFFPSVDAFIERRSQLFEECRKKYPQYENLHITAVNLVLRKGYSSLDAAFKARDAAYAEAKNKYPEEKERWPIAAYLVMTQRYPSIDAVFARRKKLLQECMEKYPEYQSYHDTIISLVLRNTYKSVDAVFAERQTVLAECARDYPEHKNIHSTVSFLVITKLYPSIKAVFDRRQKILQEFEEEYPRRTKLPEAIVATVLSKLYPSLSAAVETYDALLKEYRQKHPKTKVVFPLIVEQAFRGKYPSIDAAFKERAKRRDALLKRCEKDYPKYALVHSTAVYLVMNSKYPSLEAAFSRRNDLLKKIKLEYPEKWVSETAVDSVWTKRSRSLEEYFRKNKKT
ncbi:MAG: hypothetical protein AABW72_00730 [archaeon]